jgi:alpha-D-xyloside xylohydrolase/alpha-glucosidase
MPSLRCTASGLVGLLVLASTTGCSSDDEKKETKKEPIVTQVGGFFARVRPDAAALDILAPDGRPLIEGLGKGAVNDDEPPLVGFAVRDVTEEWEMQFGAFRPKDTFNGAWRVASRVDKRSDGGDPTYELRDGAGSVLASLTLTQPSEGHLRLAFAPGDGPERRLSWGWACNADDHFAGFGAQTWDVDHRGHTLLGWVQEQGVGKDDHNDYTGLWMIAGRRYSSHVPIPQLLSRRGYVMVAETDRRSLFALCEEREDAARAELELPAVVHMFDGPAPKVALERATEVFGRPRLPAPFAFAPWNDAIYGSENVRRVAQKLRDRGIPSSVIWTEDWKGAEQKGDAYALSEEWEVDRTLYPDFEALADDLHGMGFKFLVYFNTFIYEGTSAWDETAPNGYLVQTTDGQPYKFTGAKMSDTGLIDLSNPGARDWAKAKLQEAIDLGADGWMGDFAEWMPTDGTTHAGPSLEQHNLHAVQWQEVQREVLDANTDADRLFFGRSGWFGTPPLADVIWAADQRTSFQEDDGLPTILPIGIGLGLVGISTFGHDIAGYQSSTNPPTTKELFFRWTELGAWSPVMRTHHGYQAKLNWSWESDEETTEHFARYARLHVALAPYWMGLAKVATETGIPIWRGLALEFPEDAAVWPIKDQVMVGDGVMIAPVVVEGATKRPVYLPAGRWYVWEGGARESEGEAVDVDAALEEIPVYARAGAVVPMFPEGVMTLADQESDVPGPGSVADDRIVHVFLGADGALEESSGLRYEQLWLGSGAMTPASTTYRIAGQQLGACDASFTAPCVEKLGAERDAIHVVGPGAVEVVQGGTAIARITASQGKPDRKLTFDVRR